MEGKNYKDTLNMPRTDFEMRGNLPKKEPLMAKQWEAEDQYHQVISRHHGQKAFVLHDGPPYANGNLHAGTAMNRVIKDFINRSHAMNGYYTPFFPGWDTHGLPIENAVQKLGVDRKSMPKDAFRAKCEEYAKGQVETQMATMKRLGTMADFDHPYITLQKGFEARQIRTFGKMAAQGLIFQGYKPIYWSPYNETAIADSEIVYFDRKDTSIFVAFKVADTKGVLDGDESFVIWTTTPWTIPANLAICLNERFMYAVVETTKGKLIVLDSKVDQLMAKFGIDQYRVIKTIVGKDLEYITAHHPLYADRTSLVILGDHVTDEDGTGCVHTAPGHGAEDFAVCQKYKIPTFCPVDAKGCLTDDAGAALSGMFVFDANSKVIDMLDQCGALMATETITHSYPHDDRLKKPVIFRATKQWFCSIDKIRDQLLDQIDHHVTWHNQWGQIRIHNMIASRGDWCISRQRLWGVPIPIIYNEDGSPIMDEAVFDHIADLFEQYGSNVWFQKEAKDLLRDGYTNPASPNGGYTKENDIMDVWFDSGSSFNELQARGYDFPADLYFEGSDQYRGWFNSSLIVSTASKGCAPYKAVLSHGYVCDSKGEKMSKSVGNVVNPMDVIDQYGADIFRLWAMTSDYTEDMRIGPENLKQVAEQYRKVRNTFKFMLGNVNADDFDPTTDQLAYADMSALNRYMLLRLKAVNAAVIDDYMHYNFVAASVKLTNFMVNELSAYYLSYTKDILYIQAKDDPQRRGVQTVIWQLTDTLCKLWAPILVFTMDEVWHHFTDTSETSVHYTQFNALDDIADDPSLIESMEIAMSVRADVLKALEQARNDGKIKDNQQAALSLVLPQEKVDALHAVIDNIAQWLIVSKVDISSGPTQINVQKANGHVCPRCWNVVEEVDEDGLCPRCHGIIHHA